MRMGVTRCSSSTAVLLSLLLVASCQGKPAAEHGEEHAEAGEQHADEERLELSPEAVQTANIRSEEIRLAPLDQEIEATAVIKPNEYRMAHVGPRIAGRAVQVSAELGHVVEPGQPLALLDSLELGEKKSAFLEARARRDVADRNYRREEQLFKEKISSQKEYLEAKGELESADAAYRGAREALRLLGLADGEIDSVKWGGAGHPLSHFPLVAPFAGTVIERHITVGELVEPEEKPFTIADLSTVWIIVDVYEKDLARVKEGTEVTLSTDAYPNETFRGKTEYVSNVLEPTTRTAQARLVVGNGDGRLRPGMFARAMITVPSAGEQQTLVIPRDAVQNVRGKPVAFVEEAPGKYEMRELELGRETARWAQVRAGLATGERVVSQGSFYLKSTLLKEEMGEGHAH